MGKHTYAALFSLPVLVLGAIGYLLTGCSDNTTNGPDLDTDFSVQITVQDDQGNPLQDLQVSCWNCLDITSSSSDCINPSIVTQPSQTVIQYDIVIGCLVQMYLLDLEGNHIATAVDAIQSAGYWSVMWNAGSDVPCGVYSCILETTDTLSSELLFSDTIYPVLWRPDPTLTVVGYTSALGSVNIADRRIFPNTYKLPVLHATDPCGTDQGLIEFSNSVHFVITDTASTEYMTFDSTITLGENHYTVVWNPSKCGQIDTTISRTILERENSLKTIKADPIIPDEWRLRQNYPNPFN